MEALKSFFHLDIILRQLLGGASFFTLYVLQHRQVLHFFHRVNGIGLTAIIIVTFLAGAFFHVLSRAALGSVIDLCRTQVLKSKIFSYIIFDPEARKMSLFRFKFYPDFAHVSSELKGWGSSAHCLYTIAVACAVAQYLGPNRFCLPWFFFGFLALLGFLTDCRKYLLEEEIRKNCPELKHCWERDKGERAI